jgi:hypothetical protein
MPTLEFKGKPFVYSHHLSVPFRELVVDPKKSLPAKGQKASLDGNLIIHGDNLEALKALCFAVDADHSPGSRSDSLRARHPLPQGEREAWMSRHFASLAMIAKS